MQEQQEYRLHQGKEWEYKHREMGPYIQCKEEIGWTTFD